MPIEDVGSIDSSSEDEDELPTFETAPPQEERPTGSSQENQSVVTLGGESYKFSKDEDKQILRAVLRKNIEMASEITELHREAFRELKPILSLSEKLIEARFLILQQLFIKAQH